MSSYSFPVTLFNKEGEKARLDIDFRKLNKITVADNFSFPRIVDIMNELYGSRHSSVLDMNSSFWHVRPQKYT